MPLYIEKKLMVTSTNQPTDQQGEYRAICLFRKLENRKKAEICNIVKPDRVLGRLLLQPFVVSHLSPRKKDRDQLWMMTKVG